MGVSKGNRMRLTIKKKGANPSLVNFSFQIHIFCPRKAAAVF